MHDIQTDLSTLTTISKDDIAKFFRKVMYCCGDAVLEDVLQEKDVAELDLGVGILYVKLTENPEELAYKFIPSIQFQSILKTTLTKKLSPVSRLVGKSVNKNFMQAYKNLC